MSTCYIETMLYRASEEVEVLVCDFESCTLPREKWTHRAHLTIALWYLLGHPLMEATRLIHDSIQKYNHAHGIIMTRESGYHETMTLFWIRVVHKYLDSVSDADVSLVTLANGLIERCGNKNLPLEYYSRERLMSWEARTSWVEPDLKRFD